MCSSLYLWYHTFIDLFSLHFIFSFLFFFKQKTAYEMRISDWSSDVCSSDLGRFDHEGNIDAGWSAKTRSHRQLASMVRHRLIPRRIIGQVGYVATKLFRDEGGEIMGYRSLVLYQLRQCHTRVPSERELPRSAQLVQSHPSPIGRAACRSRVVQHVY